MSPRELVTVGLPTCNRAIHLRHAIEGILAQTMEHFELVVVDDASQDETKAVVESFQDGRIRYCRNSVNTGIPAVLNQILDMAKGRSIVILHDHDIFSPALLELLQESLDLHPSLGFVNPGVAWMDEDGRNYEQMSALPSPL